MKCTGSQSTSEPSKVTLEHLPNGETRVMLADNIVKSEDEEGNDLYTYDEVVFNSGEDVGTPAEVEAEFESWWEYGLSEDDPLPTLEERVTDIEMFIMGLEA